MGAKAKITLFIGLLFTSIILLVSVVGFLNFKSASVKGYKDQLGTKTVLISKAIEQRMERYFDALEIMANDIEIDSSGLLNVDRTVAELHTMTEKLGVIDTYIALENGATYAHASDGLEVGFNAKEKKREWYLRIFNGEERIITTPYTCSEGWAVMAVAVPIKREGKILAVLCLNLAVNQLTDFIQSLTEENQLFVSRKDGYLLASQNTEVLGENLYELCPSYKQYQNDDKSIHSYEYQGKQYQVVSSRIDSLGWSVWSWEPWTNISAASNDNLKINLIMALVLICASLYTIYLIIVKLMYIPIGGEPTEIETLVKNIAQGNLGAAPLLTARKLAFMVLFSPWWIVLKVLLNISTLLHNN